MVVLFTCVIVLAAAYSFWYLAARRTSGRHGWQVMWRLAVLIASLRIGALWIGAATNHSSGWVQIPGYFLQLIGLPEIYFVRSMRNTELKWEMTATLLLLATSFVWAALFVWVANRLPAKMSVPTDR